MMDQKAAQDLVKRHGNKKAAARASGLSETTFRRLLHGETKQLRFPAGRTPPAGRVTSPGEMPASAPGIAVTKFLHQFDYEAQLLRTLRKLCLKRFVADNDIRSAANLPAAVYRRVTELPAFEDWKTKIDGRLWWSAPQNIKQVRAQQTNWGLR